MSYSLAAAQSVKVCMAACRSAGVSLQSFPSRCLPVPTGTCTIIRDSQYYVAVPERRDDKTLFQTLSDLGSSIHINSFCVDVLLTVTCYYLFPDCNIEVGSQLVFCQSMCPEIEMLKARCSEEFNELRMIESDFADFLTNLTCSDPNTYAVSGVDIDQDKCVDLQKLSECHISCVHIITADL